MDAASSLQSPGVSLTPAKSTVSPSPRAWWASWALLAVAWLLIWNQQRLEWTVNATYAYGWAVPVLAGYLFYERWRTRPHGSRPVNTWIWLIAPALLLLAYLPVRVVQEANPDWVKINWIMAGLVIGLSFSAVFSVAGWRAMLHCAFPILFCMTALPWPVWIEDNLTKSLMSWNATACAELLTIAGFPAITKGNLIMIGTSWVNVEEACSGVRSLQTAFMVSLFFGEFHRLGWIARGLLMLCSFVVAFGLNFGRTVTLTYLGGQGGNELAEKWHDTVGNIVMILCLVLLWVLAEAFQRWRSRPAQIEPTKAPTPARAPFPFWFALLGVAWLGTAEAANEGWYARHERAAAAPIAWDLKWPGEAPDFRQDELGERSRALLKYNEGHLATWRTQEGFRWQMYYLRWLPGRVSKFLAGGHYPTVCLPAGGLRLVSETGPFVSHVGGLTIPFVTYLFDDNGRDVYVFHAILEDNQASYDSRVVYRQANSTERLRSVLRGERNLGQRVIGVAITGPLDAGEARDTLESTLQQIVLTEANPDAPLTRS
ncbi:MAG TPA: exosortase/archaeosortase family protein [Opitutus sp.]|nr:exosortase/archaeosortase family protein [Opitutus sp.]